MWGGKAAAIQFAREGAKVLCVDRDGALAESTANTIRGEGGLVRPFVADIVVAWVMRERSRATAKAKFPSLAIASPELTEGSAVSQMLTGFTSSVDEAPLVAAHYVSMVWLAVAIGGA